jgi:hypothetical protein
MATSTNIVRLGLESNDYEKGIRNAQKQWNDFTKSLGVNIGKFTAVAAAAGTVTAAMKVAKDAFFKNEQQLDEWGRSVESAKSLYSGFLNALNNGNISGYLNNINQIVAAARQAYDALDELGTFNAFNQVNQERARTAFTEAMADYREGTGSKESVQAAAAALQNELRERQTREQGAYEAAIANLAAQRGIDPAIMQRIMTGSYAELQQYKSLGLSGSKTVFQSNGMFGGTSSYQVATAANEQERIGEALRQLNDTEIQALQALGAQAQRTGTEIANLDKQVARVLRGGGTTTGGGTSASSDATKEEYTPLAGSIDAQVAKVKELQDAFNAAGSDGIRMGLLPQLKEAEQTLERMKNVGDFMVTSPTGIPGTELSAMPAAPTINNSDLEKAQALAAIAEKNREAWLSAASAIGSVGSALQNIESPAAKVAGIIAEAIATIAATFAASLKGTVTPWDWIAGAAAGTATMIATIASIKQATSGFAAGGIIPGSHYSGDMQLARVNSGELILNQAQQGVLASRLQNDNALSNLHLQATLSGENIRIALTNNMRRSGSGENISLTLR